MEMCVLLLGGPAVRSQSSGRCIPDGELHIGNIEFRLKKQKVEHESLQSSFPQPSLLFARQQHSHHSDERQDCSQFPFARLDAVPCLSRTKQKWCCFLPQGPWSWP